MQHAGGPLAYIEEEADKAARKAAFKEEMRQLNARLAEAADKKVFDTPMNELLGMPFEQIDQLLRRDSTFAFAYMKYLKALRSHLNRTQAPTTPWVYRAARGYPPGEHLRKSDGTTWSAADWPLFVQEFIQREHAAHRIISAFDIVAAIIDSGIEGAPKSPNTILNWYRKSERFRNAVATAKDVTWPTGQKDLMRFKRYFEEREAKRSETWTIQVEA